MLIHVLFIKLRHFISLLKFIILDFIISIYDFTLFMKFFIMHFLMVINCILKNIFQTIHILISKYWNIISKIYHIYAKPNLAQLNQFCSNQTTIHTHHIKIYYFCRIIDNESPWNFDQPSIHNFINIIVFKSLNFFHFFIYSKIIKFISFENFRVLKFCVLEL